MQPNGFTNLFCLLGNPAKHSISPKMHNTAFESLNLNNCYLAFDVDVENFPNAITGFVWKSF